MATHENNDSATNVILEDILTELRGLRTTLTEYRGEQLALKADVDQIKKTHKWWGTIGGMAIGSMFTWIATHIPFPHH
jgi:hypothetical protein